MPDLITLNELKIARGVPLADVSEDDAFEQVISLASSVIIAHSGRDFGAPLVTETRSFVYDDSGFLDIDDAQAITEVAVVVPGYVDIALSDDEWMPMPGRRDDTPVYWYIIMPTLSNPHVSPEMGFKRNLDRLYYERGFRNLPQTVNVTATWGWPVVPEPVKLAVVWTIEDWLAAPTGGEDLTSESIEGFSRSWGRSGEGRNGLAIPNRALSVLANYDKIMV